MMLTPVRFLKDWHPDHFFLEQVNFSTIITDRSLILK